jgi:hypothetical protein
VRRIGMDASDHVIKPVLAAKPLRRTSSSLSIDF